MSLPLGKPQYSIGKFQKKHLATALFTKPLTRKHDLSLKSEIFRGRNLFASFTSAKNFRGCDRHHLYPMPPITLSLEILRNTLNHSQALPLSLLPTDIMNSHLKYRGRSFEHHTPPPTKTVRTIGFRGRKTLASPPAASLPEDIQFFGWHPEGLAPA